MPVQVPDELASEVLRALVRDLAERVRTHGGAVSPACRTLLSQLYDASRGPVADDGQGPGESDRLDVPAMATTAQLAERSGYSCRTLRRWAASGRLTARRVGRSWLIDSDSLTEDR
jgi:excisionase family DNA binding protein